MAGRTLTAIPGGKEPEPRVVRKRSLAQALASGSEIDELVALRDLAAKKLADPKISARDFGTISKQLREYSVQIASLKSSSTRVGEAITDDDDDVDLSWSPDPS